MTDATAATPIRETEHFTVVKSARGYRISLKGRKEPNTWGVKTRVVSERIWNQLRHTSNQEFENSVVLELGIC
jgi:hypothetical protein